MTTDESLHFMKLALLEAEKCEPTPTAFCVGCVIVARWPSTSSEPVILATGYSRELTANTHAEANALAKARTLPPFQLRALFHAPPDTGTVTIDDILHYSDVYTTMEPCSIRTSGLAPCADALIAAHVQSCFIGVGEPDDFVTCEGAQKLIEAGIKVIWVKGLEEECLKVARKDHANKS